MVNRIALPLSLLVLACTVAACGPEGWTPETGAGIPVTELLDGKADGARTARFETFTGIDGRTYFHLLAGNGEKVLQSQGYVSEDGARAGIASVRANGAATENYALLESVDGQWYFNLIAANGAVVATSELYVTRANAERGLATVAELVPAAAAAPATTGARFEVFRGLDGQHYFHLRAPNGEIVLQSEGYTRHASALDGIASVRANGTDVRRYEVRDAANGQAYFVLTAANGWIIGISEAYASRTGARRGVETVASLLTAAE